MGNFSTPPRSLSGVRGCRRAVSACEIEAVDAATTIRLAAVPVIVAGVVTVAVLLIVAGS